MELDLITISLCMIVKDEEAVLGRCLNSCAGAFDEIVIVDTGSTDRTMEIARRYTGKVYQFEWGGDFAAARNYSFSKATGQYIMWLDADDIMLPADIGKLRILKKVMAHTIDVVMMKYDTAFDDNGITTASLYRERLVKRAAGLRWLDPVNEYIPISGRVTTADVTVTHRPKGNAPTDRNLEIYRGMLESGAEFNSRNILNYARELKNHALFDEAAEQYEKFLSHGDGLAEDNISACFELSFIYRSRQDYDGMLGVLLQSFKYGPPRAETCCQIGEYHFERKAYREAIFWYELALRLEKPFSWRFMFEDYWGYIPALQLCLSHYSLGDTAKAVEYNRLAKRFKSFDPSVLSNEQFFANLRQQGKADF